MDIGFTKISKAEIYRYLGCNSGIVPKDTAEKVNSALEELKGIATPRITYKIFQKGTEPDFKSNDVSRLLKNCKITVIFGATLGTETDKYLMRLQITDLAYALIFDACCNAGIENICDNFLQIIQREYGSSTLRFSPGYGDFPIEMQNLFEKELGLQKSIGVTALESGVLVPQKSVTAVFGVKENVNENE